MSSTQELVIAVPKGRILEELVPLLDKAGVEADEGFIPLGSANDIRTFLESCRKLRLWAREPKVKL